MVSQRCYYISTFIPSRTQKWLDYIFIWLSQQIPSKKLIFIFIGIIISLSFSLGLLNLTIENRFPYLVIPRDTVLWAQFTNILNIFGEPPPLMSLLLTTKNENNILLPQILNETYDIFNILYDSNVIEYKNELYGDICLREYPLSPTCTSTNENLYGIFFENNPFLWQNINDTLIIINEPGSPINYYIGGISYDNQDSINKATILRLTYELESNDYDKSYGFQKEFDEYWKIHSNDYKNDKDSKLSSIYHLSDRSLDDEINRVIIVDAGVFSSSFITMLIYLCLLLGTFTCIGIRIWLAFSIILILICSLCIGYGFACMIGAEMSIIVMLVPYILIGVGVDDMIILVDTYDRMNNDLTKTLQISGLSISLTSFCSVLAFAIASLAPNAPPAIVTFCVTASASFFALYLIQFLLFVPLMLYDQNRMESNGNFLCPCYRHTTKKIILFENDGNYDTTNNKKQRTKQGTGCYFDAPLILQRTIVPLMKYRICRWIIIISFISVLIVSICFIPSIDRETDSALMVPSDSFVLEYQSQFESSFDAQLLTEVQIIIENEDFSNSQTRQNINNLFMNLSEYPKYISLSNWLQPFEFWLLNDKQIDINNITNIQFYHQLQSFVNVTQYRTWDREIIYGYNDDDKTMYIKATRFYLRAFKDESVVNQYDDYINYNNMMSDNSINGYMFEEEYGFAYLSHIIVGLTIENMLYCAFGVFFILIIFMDLRIAIFCFIIVAMIDVWFIGWMILLNISLDPITYACLVMAVGLTVDYVIHIVHSISKSIPINNKNDYTERLSIAMNEMGGSVFKGAITTLLGGFPLLFSTSKGFVYFYAMVSGIVLCALLHGMLLTPALLGEFPWIYQKYDNHNDIDNGNDHVEDTKNKEIQMISDDDDSNHYGAI